MLCYQNELIDKKHKPIADYFNSYKKQCITRNIKLGQIKYTYLNYFKNIRKCICYVDNMLS